MAASVCSDVFAIIVTGTVIGIAAYIVNLTFLDFVSLSQFKANFRFVNPASLIILAAVSKSNQVSLE